MPSFNHKASLLEKLRPSTYLMSVICLVGLIIVSYGDIWSRGAYADDFMFMIRSTGGTYWEVVLDWYSSYNSRISQAVILPLMFRMISGEVPEMSNWWVIHGIGVLGLIVMMLIFERILFTFGFSKKFRLVACVVFSLHPSKTEVVFWPEIAVCVPYLIAFFASVWLYLHRAKAAQAEWVGVLILTLGAIPIAISLEQVLPFFCVLVFGRLMFFKTRISGVILNLSGILVLVGTFLVVTFNGASVQMLGRVSGERTDNIMVHGISVIVDAFKLSLFKPLSIFVDEFYRRELIEILTSPSCIVGTLIIILLTFLIFGNSASANTSRLNKKTMLGGTVGGVAIFLGTLTPFMVISYSLSNHVLYLPSVGIGLLFATSVIWLWDIRKGKFGKYAMIVFFSCVCFVFLVGNLFVQKEFAKIWRDEQMIMSALRTHSSDIPNGSTVELLGLPRYQGFSPDVQVKGLYIFNQIVQWMLPGRGITGNSTSTIADVFDLHTRELDFEVPQSLFPQESENKVVFVWTPSEVIRIAKLEYDGDCGKHGKSLATDKNQNSVNTQPELKSLRMCYASASQQAQYEQGITVSVDKIFYIDSLDTAVVPVVIETQQFDLDSILLIAHADVQGVIMPYVNDPGHDLDPNEETHRIVANIEIADFSKLHGLKLGLINKKSSRRIKLISIKNAGEKDNIIQRKRYQYLTRSPLFF